MVGKQVIPLFCFFNCYSSAKAKMKSECLCAFKHEHLMHKNFLTFCFKTLNFAALKFRKQNFCECKFCRLRNMSQVSKKLHTLVTHIEHTTLMPIMYTRTHSTAHNNKSIWTITASSTVESGA